MFKLFSFLFDDGQFTQESTDVKAVYSTENGISGGKAALDMRTQNRLQQWIKM